MAEKSSEQPTSRLAEANGGALMEGQQLMCGFADICSDTKEAM